MESPSTTTSLAAPPLWAISSLPEPPLARWLGGRHAGLLIAAAIVAVYAAGVSTFWWIGRDSALYLNLAHNLATGNGYTLAGQPHTHVPPGLPMILGSLVRLSAPMVAINALMAFIALAAVGASYGMLSQLVAKPWAMLITLATALLCNTFELGTEILSDMPFMLLVMAGLLLYYRGLNQGGNLGLWTLGSIMLVASCGMRVLGFVVVAAAGIGLLIAAWPKARAKAIANFAILAVLGAGLLAAFYLYYRGHKAADASNYVSSIAVLTAGTHGLGWLVKPFERLYTYSGELGRLLTAQHLPTWLSLVLLALPAAAAMFRRLARRDVVGPLVVVLYVGAICVVLREPRVRYLVPLAPLLVLYVLEGWSLALTAVLPSRPRAITGVAAALVAMVILFNIPLVAKTIAEKHGDYRRQQHGQYASAIDMAEFLRRNPPYTNVLAEQYIGYLAGVPCPKLSRQVVDGSPTPDELHKLLRRLGVGAVVISRKPPTDKDKPTPFARSLEQLVKPFGPPIMTTGTPQKGTLELYELY